MIIITSKRQRKNKCPWRLLVIREEGGGILIFIHIRFIFTLVFFGFSKKNVGKDYFMDIFGGYL